MLTRPLTSVICFWCRLNGSCCCGFEIPPVWLHLSCCVPWTRQHCLTAQQKTSLSTLSLFGFQQLFVFPFVFRHFPLSARASSVFQPSLSTQPSHSYFLLPAHLICSSVFLFHHPTSTLSVSLSIFILTGLCKGSGGEINYHCITPGYIWRHDATDVSGNILVPFLSALFLYVERNRSCCFFNQRCVQKPDVAVCPPQGCDTCCKLC